MATQNGTNYAKFIDPQASNRLKASEYNGKLRVIFDDFTFAGESAGEVINIGKVPKGARVLGVFINNAALGAGVTLDIGDASDADRLVAAADANSSPPIGLSIAQSGFDYEYEDATIITMTTAGAAATGLVETAIIYAVE